MHGADSSMTADAYHARFQNKLPAPSVWWKDWRGQDMLKIDWDHGMVPDRFSLATSLPGVAFCVAGRGLKPSGARNNGYGELRLLELREGFTFGS